MNDKQKHAPEGLWDLYFKGMQHIAETGGNPLLATTSNALRQTFEFIESEPAAAHHRRGLRELMTDRNWAIDPECVEKLFQRVGEAQFHLLAKTRGVEVEHIPPRSKAQEKTPDFLLRDPPVHFEVKTLSIKDGQDRIERTLDQGFENQLEIDARISKGARYVHSTREIAPYGEVPRDQMLTMVCRLLIGKAQQNIKRGQFEHDPTLLVLNLTLLGLPSAGPDELRPVTVPEPNHVHGHTGTLWTTGFGEASLEILGFTQFEGDEQREGKLDRDGLLSSLGHPYIKGILFLITPWQGEQRLYGLWRSPTHAQWQSTTPAVCDMLARLVGSNWNDELDSNGAHLAADR